MTSFDIAEGNPGAFTFILIARNSYPILADFAFFRMERYRITGCALYMLWNDCCDRDTKLAVEAALYCPIDFLESHINQNGGRGIRIESKDVIEFMNNSEYRHYSDPRFNF